jgi:hypothetical protein
MNISTRFSEIMPIRSPGRMPWSISQRAIWKVSRAKSVQVTAKSRSSRR